MRITGLLEQTAEEEVPTACRNRVRQKLCIVSVSVRVEKMGRQWPMGNTTPFAPFLCFSYYHF